MAELFASVDKLDLLLLEVKYIRAKLDDFATRDEMDAKFGAMRTEMNDGFARQDRKLAEFREEFNQFRIESRGNLSQLRITTAQGFESLNKRVEILRRRVDRIERYLGI